MSSCLVAKLSHYIDLGAEDSKLLENLEKDEQEHDRGSLIHSLNDEIENLYVVKSGWLYNYLELADGRRQIIRIHHPGDVLGIGDIAYKRAGSNLMASTDVILCPFPKSHLDAIFVTAPRLTSLLFTIAVRDQAILVDVLMSIGRMSARERMAFILLDLLSRLRVTNKDLVATFRCPLSQKELGDSVALTPVYVRRTLAGLEDEGLIEQNGDNITILNEEHLKTLCDFTERYESIDTSWFPQ